MHVCLQITIIMKHNQTENIEKIFTEICKDLEFQTFNIFKNFWYSFIDKNKPKISLKIKDPTRSQDIYKDFFKYIRKLLLCR